MIKPKLELSRQNDNLILSSAKAVKNAMTTNAAEFPDSGADVGVLGGAIATYEQSLQDVIDGKLVQQGLVDAKDAARAAVEAALRVLAGQVNEVANGDINVIHDAGMQGTSEPTPVTMPQIQNVRLTPSDHDGELLMQWDPVPEARVVQVQVCLDPNAPPTNWQDKLTTTKSKCRLNDTLVSGQKIWARARAVGARDEGAWSDPTWKTVP